MERNAGRERSSTGRDGAPLVILEGITKRFPGVVANDSVDLDLESGEIHALVGENGAGKSTLMRVLYGLYPPDDGRILVRGEEVRIASPRDAIGQGIGMVHQHFVLVDRFTVAENIILGAEGGALVDFDGAAKKIDELAQTYGFADQPDSAWSRISPSGEEQRVEILKALYRGVDLLILDEPTAVLTPSETKELFENLRKLQAGREDHRVHQPQARRGTGSRRSDHGSPARQGRRGDDTGRDDRKQKLAEMMVGRPVLFRLEKPEVETGDPILEVSEPPLEQQDQRRGPHGQRGRDPRRGRCRGQRPARVGASSSSAC